MLSEKIRSYFIFSKRERIGIYVLVILILAAAIGPGFIHDKRLDSDLDSIKKFEAEMAALHARDAEDSIEKKEERRGSAKNTRLFYFDPNSLDPAGWKKLGLHEKTIQTIMRYLEKGGRFRKADDLLKIYGMRENEFVQLKPFVQIKNETEKKPFRLLRQLADSADAVNSSTSQPFNPPSSSQPFNHSTPQPFNHSTLQPFNHSTSQPFNPPSSSQPFNHSTPQPIDINKADSIAFMAFRGIGQKLAARIISFRQKLGGFYSVDQVRETYGLPDSVFISIRPLLKIGEDAEDSLKKIDLNESGIEQLRQHPYIRWNLARAIVEFRNQHGPFSKPEDLEKLHILSQAEIQKIMPYLKIN